jgi:hypothetical protein
MRAYAQLLATTASDGEGVMQPSATMRLSMISSTAGRT